VKKEKEVGAMQQMKHYRKTVTFRFADGVSGAGLVDSKVLPYSGEILGVRQLNTSNTNSVTAQLTIEEPSLGSQMWDGTAKNHNTQTNHEFVSARRILAGGDTLKCTLSGDPGATGAKVDVILSIYGRDT
jgi:hypothetical protein